MQTGRQERSHLGTLVADMERWGSGSLAIVEHRGVRSFPTSYGALARLARRFAAELDRRGIEPGDRVLLWGRNSAAWTAAFFGCVLRGVLVVPLDAMGSVSFAERIARDVRPSLIVADQALLDRWSWADTEAPTLALETLETVLPSPSRQPGPPLTSESPLQILFTSGTTGEPKGVVHTHRNLIASIGPIEREIARYRRYERLVHPLRFLHTLPLSHVFGQFMGLWIAPLLGATVHYESRVTASRLLALIPREGINVLAAVPRTLSLLQAQLLADDAMLAEEIAGAGQLPIANRWWRFRRIHRSLGIRFWAAVCGGATLPAELEQFWTRLGFALIQGYGLTETAALVTLNHPFKTARGSLGSPLPGRALRLSLSGELEVRGDMVSQQSWQDGRLVERTNAWLATGDLAEFDEQGRLRFLGRTGQRIVTAAGLNVYLQDIEQALAKQPGVQECIVFALPTPNGEEEPAAVIIARAGEAVADDAVAAANAGLLPHQQIRQWWLWPELQFPRTASSKVQRRAIEMWAENQAFHILDPGLESEETTIVTSDTAMQLLRRVNGHTGPPGDDAALDADWGLDSMGRVALAAALEETLGVPVADALVSGITTLGDLRDVLRGEPVTERKPEVVLLRVPARRLAGGGRTAVDELPQRTAASPAVATSRSGVAVQIAPAVKPTRSRYPRWPWSRPVQWLRIAFLEAVLRPLVRVLGAARVRGAVRPLRDTRGPLLLISNHRTALDVPLILFALPAPLRWRVAVAMSGEMLAGWERSWSPERLPAALAEHRRWWGPPVAFLLRALLNVFPLPRTAGFRRSFEHAGAALDRGYSVLIFPEGRRAPAGTLSPFKPGLGLLAQESFVPVLPLHLSVPADTEQQWFRSAPEIKVGRPIVIDATGEAEQLTRDLQAEVERLSRPSS